MIKIMKQDPDEEAPSPAPWATVYSVYDQAVPLIRRYLADHPDKLHASIDWRVGSLGIDIPARKPIATIRFRNGQIVRFWAQQDSKLYIFGNAKHATG